MKITLNGLELNPNGEIPKNFSIETSRQIQTEYALSSGMAKVFDRGNVKTLAQFEIERSHASEAQAQMFALKHAAQVSEKSAGEIDFNVPGGMFSNRTIRFKSAFPSKIKIQIVLSILRTAFLITVILNSSRPKKNQDISIALEKT